jgi:hypothetical protein
MVIVLLPNAAVTPPGRPVAVPIPVAPVVVWVMFVRTVLIHKVGVLEAAPTVLLGVTVIVPVAVRVPPEHPADGFRVKVYVPDVVGVPEIVTTPPENEAFKPVTPEIVGAAAVAFVE